MIWIAGIYAVMSIVSFGVYGWDKHKARLGRWRIEERTLHLADLLGGWPGAFLAQRLFHHKLQKASFMRVFWATVILHVALLGYLGYRCLQ